MKHILLIATGGTIASKDNGNGLTPSIDVNILLEYIPAIRHICSVNGISIMNIDSSNMNTDYDVIIICHYFDFGCSCYHFTWWR